MCLIGNSTCDFMSGMTRSLNDCRDNEYILSGYRTPSGSYWKSLLSMGALHNETINIFSHSLGATLFFALPFIIFGNTDFWYATTSVADIVVFSTFFYGVATCFLLSATFHVVNNHSPTVASFGNQLDYLGIVILMWGSTIPCVYYGFYCSPQLQLRYWMQVSVLAIICTILTLNPRFRTPAWRAFRSAMYSGLGLSFLVPIIHGLVKFGLKTQMWRMSLDWMLLMATFNLTGALIYAWRIPEKWYPVRYDFFGSSHQILHFMVIFAGIAHLFGLLRAYRYSHSKLGQCI